MSDLTNRKALLTVSFGTTYQQTAEATIGAIEKDLAAAFPDRAPFSGWTSKMVVARIERETGFHHLLLHEALEEIAQQGAEDLLIQPTHLMRGDENAKIFDAIAELAADIPRVHVGDTLLATEEDCRQVAAIMAEEFPRVEDEMVLFMGHGSPEKGNEVYWSMNECFAACGRDDVIVATVEGDPDFAYAMERIGEQTPARVVLAPFMVVAGDHANNDLAGDEPDSWKSQIAAAGFPSFAVLRGLGEYPGIRALFVEHARKALETGVG